MQNPNTCDVLLTGGSVVTMDDNRRVIEPGAIAIQGDRILAVGPKEELADYRARRTIRCDGKAIMPGLVDCHTHLMQSLARGLGEGVSLYPWLCEFMFPYSSNINPAEARAAAYLGGTEAVRAGITCVVDNHYAPTDSATTLAVAEAIEEVGLRGVVARGIFGEMTDVAARYGLPANLFKYSPEEELDIMSHCLDARPPEYKVRIWPAPINILYVAQDLVRHSIELAIQADVNWHAHCSEASADPDIYIEMYGVRPVEWMHQEGLLGEGGTLAHAIWLDDKEIEYLGESNMGVSYNPISNQYLASGVLRLRDLRSAGAVVGLGTDGPSVGHRQDLFECIKQAILLQRAHTLDPTASSAEEALELATREGARYVGMDVGVLAPGYLADIIVIELNQPHLKPLNRTVTAIAYSARSSDVAMTMVGGRIVYEEYRSTLVDESEIMRIAQVRADELIERAGMSHLRVPWRHARADSEEATPM